MSGGLRHVNDAIEVTAKPPLVTPAFHQLDPATVGQKMHMPLDGPDRLLEGCGQTRHLRPAESGLVVAVV